VSKRRVNYLIKLPEKVNTYQFIIRYMAKSVELLTFSYWEKKKSESTITKLVFFFVDTLNINKKIQLMILIKVIFFNEDNDLYSATRKKSVLI